ncbi:SDR family NAD(P)-dependent oxidoreductase [Rhizorhabdus argentea]|uniref:SDR family NAD(P)-dependent oxidoreductase n=1 Tax=Rhizorhabdus argentea TaxID=1387174 RepID=UPI0030EE69FD
MADVVDLSGRSAVVTGAGQGLGRGIAVALAEAGAAVTIAGRTAAPLEAVAAEIAALGGTASIVIADIARAEDLARIVGSAQDRFGGIDILVNNAQQAVLGPIMELDDAGYRLTFETGPLAVFRMMRACHPAMKARGGGAIVNIASSAAIAWDTTGAGVYGSMKEAIRTLSRTAASEWGRDGIRVNVIAPLAASPSLVGWLDAMPGGPDAFLATVPLGRVGDPQRDVGAVVRFLASDSARYVTGATIPVDGGQANWQ